MNTRWRLFLSYVAVMVVLVAVLSFAVRGLAVRAVSNHMAGTMGMGGAGTMMGDVEGAVGAGVNEAILWGALAGVVAAAIASYLVSGWITRPLGRMAEVADRVAAGDFQQRVSHESGDEIGRFAAAFDNMAGQLQKTEEVRQELLGTISHEIRTPLATIEGYMQGLMDGVVAAEPKTYELVRREAARLGRLVTDIERLSRLEAGAETITPRKLAVAEAIETVVAPLRPQFAHSDLSLAVSCPDPCPDVWADPDKFAQILGNLLSNALRFTPAGGLVKVDVTLRGALVAFAVEDNGVGIPAEDLPHVFERFYRVDKSRSSSGGGSGIGLAVAKALAEQMGGSINVESLAGSYTRFTFLLPRA
ncbi:MAG: HAMP domain-containing histidine kinase [Actinobacteria bacterium]|nr:HAMP domain-containing histidine kinase [Actinomycetota bacterium]